jgi:CheY-like chemotaxis protein
VGTGKLRVLVVEDEFLIADELCRALGALGAAVVGPVASVAAARRLIEEGAGIDAALLDISLKGERAYAVADALTDRCIPFVFVTGYEASVIPSRFAEVARWPKPIDFGRLEAELGLRAT